MVVRFLLIYLALGQNLTSGLNQYISVCLVNTMSQNTGFCVSWIDGFGKLTARADVARNAFIYCIIYYIKLLCYTPARPITPWSPLLPGKPCVPWSPEVKQYSVSGVSTVEWVRSSYFYWLWSWPFGPGYPASPWNPFWPWVPKGINYRLNIQLILSELKKKRKACEMTSLPGVPETPGCPRDPKL